MHWIKSVFFLLPFVLLISAAKADSLQLKLNREKTSIWEQEQFDQFVSNALKILPRSVKTKLAQSKIKVSFEKLSDSKVDLSILDIACTSTKSEALLKLGDNSSGNIKLNERLWIEILKGPQNSFTYSCGHRTGYRLALATLLHELGHSYDYDQNISRERRFLHLMTFNDGNIFTTQKNNHPWRTMDIYEYRSPKEAFAVNLEYFLMDPEYKCRRPALYEFYKEQLEHTPFASNACQLNKDVLVMGMAQKNISLDLERLYRVDYLLADKGTEAVSLFGHSMLRLVFCAPGREKSAKCVDDISQHVVISFRANLEDYRPGGLIVKKKTSFWKGLSQPLKGIGILPNFPSEMYLLNMSHVIAEYNDFDFRDLVSVPLKLTEDEKRDLLYRILEIHWGYSGSYNFVTNNCRSETEDLLKSILRNDDIMKLNSKTPDGIFDPVSPVGLRKQLYANNLVLDTDPVGEVRHLSLHRYITKTIDDLRILFSKTGLPTSGDPALGKFLLSENFSKVKTIKAYMENFPEDQRRVYILAIKNSFENTLDAKTYISILAQMRTLEASIMLYHQINIFIYHLASKTYVLENPGTLKEYVAPISDDATQADKEKADQKFKEFYDNILKFKSLLKIAQAKEPALSQGYGVPLKRDWTQPQENNFTPPEQISTELLDQQIKDVVDQIIDEDRVNLDTTIENIKLIRTLIDLARTN